VIGWNTIDNINYLKHNATVMSISSFTHYHLYVSHVM